MLRIWRISGQELPAVSMEKVLDVRDLKASLRSLHGFPMCMQQLLHKGNSLDNSTKLDVTMDLQIVLRAPESEREAELELLEACSQGYLKIASLLLEAGANKNAKADEGKTALMLAAEKGHVEIARLLLEAGANKDLQEFDDYGYHNTALMYAAGNGHVETTRLLLEAGLGKNQRNRDGYTALMNAAFVGV